MASPKQSTTSLKGGQETLRPEHENDLIERVGESSNQHEIEKLNRDHDGSSPPDVEKLAAKPPTQPDSVENPLFQPKSLKFWLTLICNFLALFLVALDRTIIATAVPRITDEFNSLGDIGWYGSAYMLTTSSAQLVYGRIYKFYDMKW
jgi:hypothetical protein